MSDSVITLNVGGILYTTTTSTLTNYPDSMLGAMFTHELPSTRDKDGNLFIDRNGHVFQYVLDFLRSSKLCLPSDFKEWDLLSAEADFYQIEPLIEAIAACREPPVPKRIMEKNYVEVIECVEQAFQYRNLYGFSETLKLRAVICGRENLIDTLPIGGVYCRSPSQSTGNLELLCGDTRLQVSKILHNSGWTLESSSLSSRTFVYRHEKIILSFGEVLNIREKQIDLWRKDFEVDYKPMH